MKQYTLFHKEDAPPGKEYDYHCKPDGPEQDWDQYVCSCGCAIFTVYATDAYETSVCCMECDKDFIVHSG